MWLLRSQLSFRCEYLPVGEGQPDLEDGLTSAASPITPMNLQHIVLLQAHILRLLYSPDPAEAAEAMREIVGLSSLLLERPNNDNEKEPCKSLSKEASDEASSSREQAQASQLTKKSVSSSKMAW